jgi:hypothetical protein
VSLRPTEWAVVQEALDKHFYDVEHAGRGGLVPKTRARTAAWGEKVRAMLPAIDAAIADRTGRSRMLGP